ncbi:hypothetical protein F5X68DRAFT_263357 [Plectosphaerella plurivora]|uniref:Uncharacterized protein n=1 Tax=Plectosphaerella plurivora TaxID=936078 RepID=A0A9P9A8Y3_9PEZI|nr:hypothetical protein F5X68DRAFT_263357 [Plectosphaerella plurivora]
MDEQDPEPSWLGFFSSYAQSSEYPAVLRYITGSFAFLGLILILPFVFLILLDLLIWAVRACWTGQPPEEAEQARSGGAVQEISEDAQNDARSSTTPNQNEGRAHRRARASSRGDG